MKKLIFILIAQVVLFTSLAYAEPIGNCNHLRPQLLCAKYGDDTRTRINLRGFFEQIVVKPEGDEEDIVFEGKPYTDNDYHFVLETWMPFIEALEKLSSDEQAKSGIWPLWLKVIDIGDIVADVHQKQRSGKSAIDIIKWLQPVLEERCGCIIDMLNKLKPEDFSDVDIEAIHSFWGPGAERVNAGYFLGLGFHKKVVEYLESNKDYLINFLIRIMVFYPESKLEIPTLKQHFRYKIPMAYEYNNLADRDLPDSPLPMRYRENKLLGNISLKTWTGEKVDLVVTSLKPDDFQDLVLWTEVAQRGGAIEVLRELVKSGMRVTNGEYGYKLSRIVDSKEIIEGFILLFNGQEHLHVHLVYANPLRKDKERLCGIGLTLERLAMEDALARNVPLTGQPGTEDSKWLAVRFGRKMLSIGAIPTRMSVIFPDQMKQTLELLDEKPEILQLPRVYNPYNMEGLRLVSHYTDFRPEMTRCFKLYGVPYLTREWVLIGGCLYDKFWRNKREMEKLILSQLDKYFGEQRKQLGRPLIIELVDPDTNKLAILTVSKYQEFPGYDELLLRKLPEAVRSLIESRNTRGEI